LQNGQEQGSYHTNPLLVKVLNVEMPELVEIFKRIRKVFKIKRAKSQQEPYQN